MEESRIELEAAIALSPNNAALFWALGTTLTLLGDPEGAIRETEKALRLSPPGAALPYAHTILSQAHLLLGHVELGIVHARKACAGNRQLHFTHVLLAAALGMNGDIEEASVALAEAIRLMPERNSLAGLRAYMTWGSPCYWALRERTINLGLRCAGMPDE